ncbi:anti-sigma factor family protein [Jiangella anatolica]|uniref:Anti-sigma factor n=1 Tax=Jiangella anatolica TaxID=2670374 RepID=A0A2W2AXH0_9ACTN|nr:zf-HC2 domain-containing protein [Jiangella anatolica]PZF79855.1 anti-sigma factor [Jiangella anatolica]
MRHLDERISDLVDDRLEHDERDRALVHLTVCAHCREAVDLERDARNALRSLPDVAPSEKLLSSLLALAEPGEPLPPAPPSSATPAPVAGWRPRDSRPPSGPSGARPGARSARRVRAVRVVALGMCTTGAMLILLASLGSTGNSPGTPDTPVSVVPPLEQFTVEHARSTGGLPFVEPASLLVTTDSSTGDGW